jgi:hypothetical protein
MQEERIDKPSIDIEKVYAVYSGKPGRCMCGCAGKYSYASKYQEFAGKNRGYSVDDDEVNDRTVRMFVKKVSESDGVNVLKGYIYSVTIGNRLYAIYTKND